MKSLAKFFIAIVGALFLQHCTNEMDEDVSPGNNASTQNPAKFEGFNFSLKSGDFWEYYWYKEVQFVSSSSTSSSSSSGNFRIVLGLPVTIEGIKAFPLEVTGENLEEYPGPRWKYIAIDQNRLLGSVSGDSLEIIFDGQNGTWFGGGFFAEFDKNLVIEARFATLDNEYVYTDSAIQVSYRNGQSFCETIAGETVCSNDNSFSLTVSDYFKAGMGPLGHSFYYAVFDQGGGFATSSETNFEIGLVATSLNAIDGFVPSLPPWVKKSDMPRVVNDAATVIWDNKIYLFGGNDQEGKPLYSSLIYDPVSDIWSEGPSVPVHVRGKAFEMGNKIYFTSVDNGTGLFEYDPVLNAWQKHSDYPSILQSNDFYATELGGLIFFFPIRNVVPANVLAYLPETSSWYNGTSSPWTFNIIAAIASDGDHIIITGGLRASTFQSSCHIYDLSVPFDSPDAWKKINGVFEEGRGRHASVAMNGKFYVLGGDNYGPVIRAVEVYDVETGNSKVLSSMNVARQNFMASTYNEKIYVMGGYNEDYLLSVEEYDPTRDRRN